MIRHSAKWVLFGVGLVGLMPPAVRADEIDALKDVFSDMFRVGGALNEEQIYGGAACAMELVKTHFNTVTPENILKWESVQPLPGQFHFGPIDKLVELAENDDLFVVGHTLVWHNQTPDWVFEDDQGNPVDRQTLLRRMKDHIFTVVGRYRGRIDGWDVVNEAFEDDGSWRQTKWLEIIGPDYIEKAFIYAHQADPDAELYYNDYNMWKEGRWSNAVKLVERLKAKGIRIDGVGLQGHWGFDYPELDEIETAIEAIAAAGVDVMITEMDMSALPSAWDYEGADITLNIELRDELNPYPDGLPDEVDAELAERYAAFFRVFVKYADVVSRVTFWGVHDGNSWRNHWPVPGRTDYPLIFDRQCRPKSAFYAIIETAKKRTFRNPVISGCYPDPSICRVGEDYYTVHSSFEYFPGVPIFHSRDLVHWQKIGYCLTRDSQLPLEKRPSSQGIFAPTLRYHDGVFYMITTNVYGGGNFYVTATDPAGPWSEPIWLDNEDIDPSFFFDDDGKVYYTRHAGGRHGHIVQSLVDVKTGELLGPMRKIWEGTGGIWPEGPHLYKINGMYYLLISEGGTSYEHEVTIARSESPWGPYEPCPDNPILTHVHRPEHPFHALGHADFVETPDGWWMVFLGIRPQGGRYHHIGREMFLAPVAWTEDGWPVVNGNGTIEAELAAPNLKPHPFDASPIRDDFDDTRLSLAWNYLRNPDRGNYSLTERPGSLCLHGTAVTLNDIDSPTFVGRRQTDLYCRVATKLDFTPAADNEEAGLTLRGNEENRYDLGMTQRYGRRKVFLRRTLKGKVVEPVVYLDIPEGEPVLSVEATPLRYEFFCSTGQGDTLLLGSALTRDLSSETIGGFTGVYFGLYATGNGQKNSSPACFDWFDYEAKEKR